MLAWALVGAFRGPGRGVERVDGAALAAELPRLTHAAARAQVQVTLRDAPAAEPRDWLAALRRAGGTVSWRPEGTIAPLALEVIPRADPAGGMRAFIASSRGDTVRLADAAGPLDTLVIDAPVAVRRLPTFVAPLTARSGSQEARTSPGDSLEPRHLYVIGNASWESKFLIAALEERGWEVRATLFVTPNIAVTQGEPLALDTANFAAVIVLDSAGAGGEALGIAAFVRHGGGFVLAGRSAGVAAFAALAPGAFGPRVRPASLSFTDSAPRRALGFDAITKLKLDAIPLEVRGGHIAVAARRAGAGRVIQVGYDETWRWRFAGGARAPDAERTWWSDLIASASYRAANPLAPRNPDAAPLAQFVAAVGPMTDDRWPMTAVVGGPPLPWYLLALILGSLVAEIASRRLRGAP